MKKTTLILAEKVEKIGRCVSELSKEVSKLSDTYGLIVEDTARLFLPSWLLHHLDIEIAGLSRAFFHVDGRVVELDFYGVGFCRKTGERVVILGEAKSRVHREDLLSFLSKVEKIAATTSIKDTVVLVVYGLYIHPTALEEAAKKNIILISPYTVVWSTANT